MTELLSYQFFLLWRLENVLMRLFFTAAHNNQQPAGGAEEQHSAADHHAAGPGRDEEGQTGDKWNMDRGSARLTESGSAV